MKHLLKNKKLAIIIFAIVCGVLVYLLNNQQTTGGYASFFQGIASDTKHVKRDYEKEFYCEFINNVGHTECLIENLDRASAIREWKQRKLEVIKHPEINIYELTPDLVDEVAKIKKWRLGFEKSRDDGCVAKESFISGSGTPGAIAKCALNYEIYALRIVDEIYYENIVGFVYGSKGIADFEPTEKDIENLMKINKTSRGCIWAGEEDCQ
jgi:hypothetical protein